MNPKARLTDRPRDAASSSPHDIRIGPQRAPRGNERTCKTWAAEAAMRMLMNNLDPEVAERPQDLVVYGGRGQAARHWGGFDAIIETLRRLNFFGLPPKGNPPRLPHPQKAPS